MNPAVTITFLRLGKISTGDAFAYVLAQFAGATLGVAVAHFLLGAQLADPSVRFVVTQPGPDGILVAFVAETVIGGILMAVVLELGARQAWRSFTGLFAASLVALYVTFEAPLSGMSMNPARTFGSAVHAHSWTALWLYFTAPLVGMLIAAQLQLFFRARASLPCGKMAHAAPCLFCDFISTQSRPRRP